MQEVLTLFLSCADRPGDINRELEDGAEHVDSAMVDLDNDLMEEELEEGLM